MIVNKLTEKEVSIRKRKIEGMLGRGETMAAIARKLDISRQALYQFVDKHEVMRPDRGQVRYSWKPIIEGKAE
jgi:transposase-like protein